MAEAAILGWCSGKESNCRCRRCKRLGFNPWIKKTPLESKMATHASILAQKIPWAEKPGGLHTVHGVAKSQMQLSTKASQQAQAQAIVLTKISVLLQEIHIQHLFDKDHSLPVCFCQFINNIVQSVLVWLVSEQSSCHKSYGGGSLL